MLTMNQLTGLGSNAAPAGYEGDAATFDGTNDYGRLSANLTGHVSSTVMFFSGWVNFNGGDGSQNYIFTGSGSRIYFARTSANVYRVYAVNASISADAILVFSSNTWTVSDGWHHVLFSCDSTNIHLYINDVSDISVTTHITGNYNGNETTWTLGANEVAGLKTNADLFDIIYAQEYVDITVEANRRNFITAAGKPADFTSAVASLSNPLAAFHLDVGETANNFADNADGTGQPFVVTGALTTATTSPTD